MLSFKDVFFNKRLLCIYFFVIFLHYTQLINIVNVILLFVVATRWESRVSGGDIIKYT
jgi:hypothetical protein